MGRKRRIFNNSDIVALIAEHGEISPRSAKRMLATVVACIAVPLRYEHPVRITGLGLFSPSMRKGRAMLGGKLVVGEHLSIRFAVSPTLKDKLNHQAQTGSEDRRHRKAFREGRIETANELNVIGQGPGAGSDSPS